MTYTPTTKKKTQNTTNKLKKRNILTRNTSVSPKIPQKETEANEEMQIVLSTIKERTS